MRENVDFASHGQGKHAVKPPGSLSIADSDAVDPCVKMLGLGVALLVGFLHRHR
jgi:hypothetical protein